MGARVPPQPQAPAQAGGGQQQGGNQALELLVNVDEGLSLAFEMLNSVPGVTDQDRQQMAQVKQGYQNIVNKLSGAGGGPSQAGPGASQGPAGQLPGPGASAPPEVGGSQTAVPYNQGR